MITLDSTGMFAKGLQRECYFHPEDKNLCIKVIFTDGGKRETEREQGYYKLLQRRNISWDMLPKFHGNIETSMGSGAVFDLIRDDNGEVSETLRHYLESVPMVELNEQGLQDSLENLKEYLLAQNIITMTIKPKNIVYQQLDEQCNILYIIDNIGNSDFIPISSHNRYFGAKKIHRKWKRFIAAMERGDSDY